MSHYALFLLFFNLSLAAKPRNEVKISIIGAGMAGLAAADKLMNEYGFTDVTIYEALNRVGGRVHPVKYGNNSFLQMGAEYIHGTDGNPMYELAKKLNALENDDNILDGYKYVPQCGDLSEILGEGLYAYTILEGISAEIEELPANIKGSYGEFITKKAESFITSGEVDRKTMEKILEIYRKSDEAGNGCQDWNDMSLRQWVEYDDAKNTIEMTDEDAILNSQGYKIILDYYLKRLPANSIRYNSHVTRIDWSKPAKIKLTVSDGTVVTSDHVIVTSSLGYLKKNSKTLFHPPLPHYKQRIIDAMGFGAMEKLFVELPPSDNRFNPSREDSIVLIKMENCSQKFTNPLTDLFWSFSLETWNPSILLAWISGRDPERLALATDEQLLDAARQVLKVYFPSSPTPIRIIRSSWLSNPLFGGCYSYYSRSAEYSANPQRELARPLSLSNQLCVQFAGEATHEDEWATTHGALMSGWREAAILDKVYPLLSSSVGRPLSWAVLLWVLVYVLIDLN